MDIPSIATERLTLRPFCRDDAATMAQVLAEPGVLRYFPSSGTITQERVERMLAGLLTHWQERGYGLWAVERQADQALLGRCGLQYLVEVDGVEVDFLLGKAYWNQGYATEAGRASIDYGWQQLGLNRIAGIVHTGNLASQRVLEKLGLRRRERAQFFGIDCYRYELVRPAAS